MNEKSLNTLEFYKIKEKLEKYAVTAGGKEQARNLSPYDSIYEVKNALEETKEAYDILIKKGNPPFEGLYDIKEALERAKKGGETEP